MENRSIIREIHGIDNARRVASATIMESDVQEVTVTDGRSEVWLALSTSSFPAGLTPEQADTIANQLRASARRIRERAPNPHP